MFSARSVHCPKFDCPRIPHSVISHVCCRKAVGSIFEEYLLKLRSWVGCDATEVEIKFFGLLLLNNRISKDDGRRCLKATELLVCKGNGP